MFVYRANQTPADLRLQLAMLRARYDHGAVAPGVYAAIRKIETDISWLEDREGRAPLIGHEPG
jgi:hypothetical protein